MEGFRCIVDCDQEELDENVEMMTSPIPWSLGSSWPSGELPKEGEEAEIPPGAWIEFDICETPILKSLTINGRLSFMNEATECVNRTIHAYWVYVRAGELLIGNSSTPYVAEGNAEIRLYGEPEEETLAPSMLVEFGNKGLFIVNKVEMYG